MLMKGWYSWRMGEAGGQEDDCLPLSSGRLMPLYAARRLKANGLSISHEDTLVTKTRAKMP